MNSWPNSVKFFRAIHNTMYACFIKYNESGYVGDIRCELFILECTYSSRRMIQENVACQSSQGLNQRLDGGRRPCRPRRPDRQSNLETVLDNPDPT